MRRRSFLLWIMLMCLPAVFEARNTKYVLPIAGVTENPEYQATLGYDVSLHFANQSTPKLERMLGQYVTNRKTRSFGRSDENSCQWAFLSVLLQLRERAREEGGNAVINIVSYCDKEIFASATEYECHAGALIAGVALKGTVVRVGK
jgi:hypothetical protein